ncbi:hypothetical protein K466DRAFT_364730 [Polyporus arcularius HHB13444]|uniref:Uncharacterized protein n=1 Tax=Polyporus arcularius HHB13444 TaxID=1314778 RepID=A0A5C3NUX2_9APHY|nr:hypothetical protein K466DRAFT_364730 [Polyporus arcularius HHB13444]
MHEDKALPNSRDATRLHLATSIFIVVGNGTPFGANCRPGLPRSALLLAMSRLEVGSAHAWSCRHPKSPGSNSRMTAQLGSAPQRRHGERISPTHLPVSCRRSHSSRSILKASSPLSTVTVSTDQSRSESFPGQWAFAHTAMLRRDALFRRGFQVLRPGPRGMPTPRRGPGASTVPIPSQYPSHPSPQRLPAASARRPRTGGL